MWEFPHGIGILNTYVQTKGSGGHKRFKNERTEGGEGKTVRSKERDNHVSVSLRYELRVSLVHGSVKKKDRDCERESIRRVMK